MALIHRNNQFNIFKGHLNISCYQYNLKSSHHMKEVEAKKKKKVEEVNREMR